MFTDIEGHTGSTHQGSQNMGPRPHRICTQGMCNIGIEFVFYFRICIRGMSQNYLLVALFHSFIINIYRKLAENITNRFFECYVNLVNVLLVLFKTTLGCVNLLLMYCLFVPVARH